MTTVLLVEDDAEIRADIAEVLQAAGYDVKTARSGHTGEALLRESATLPQLILLDLTMADGDGRGFRARQLENAELARVPVVLISGKADLRSEAEALGVAGYVAKPFTRQELLDVVSRTLRH
jgi:DNA-binding response OmpR family regulator